MKDFIKNMDLDKMKCCGGTPMSGKSLCDNERERQILELKYNHEHDDKHVNGELLQAARTYHYDDIKFWPFNLSEWKSKDELDNKIRAAALYQAEIERIERLRVKLIDEIDQLIVEGYDEVWDC